MARTKTIAYIAPFAAFLLFIAASSGFDSAHFLLAGHPARYLLFPIQTLACAGLLAIFWTHYQLQLPRASGLAILIGIVVGVLWIAPQAFFHQPPRTDGFNPTIFRGWYWPVLILRLLRLIVVVPLVEEVFWRGFLLRFLIHENIETVPFGTYAHMPNAVVAICFMFEHSYPDWPAALVTGLLYNFIAFRTRCLTSCVLAHAASNAFLGAYILMTHQWGFW